MLPQSFDSSKIIISLPALRELEITSFRQNLEPVTRFLQDHGPKILTFTVELEGLPILDLCPNMTLLNLTSHPHVRPSIESIFM